MQLPQPDINEQAKLQQLMSMLGGSKDRTKVNLGNPHDFLDIQLNGVPYEIAIPCIIQMLSATMEYAKQIQQIQTKEEKTDGNDLSCNDSVKVSL